MEKPRDLIQAVCSLAWNYIYELPVQERTKRKIYSFFKRWIREIVYSRGNLGFVYQLIQNPEGVKNIIDSLVIRRQLNKYRTLSPKRYKVTVYYLK